MQRKFIDKLSNDKILLELVKQYFELKYKKYLKNLIKIMIDNGFMSKTESDYDNIVTMFHSTYNTMIDGSLQYDYCYAYNLFNYSNLIYNSEQPIEILYELQYQNKNDIGELFKYYSNKNSDLFYVSSLYAIYTLLNDFYYEFFFHYHGKYNYELYKMQEWLAS